jgi:AcrR family transcriptional regulator
VTRERVLCAARAIFSRRGYDEVGVREIAEAAGTDPAILIRVFGSKATLFADVAALAFQDEAAFEGPLETLGERLATYLMLPLPTTTNTDESDDLQFLLRSAASITAAPILSEALARQVIGPLALRFETSDAGIRAMLVVAQVLGFATLRFALGSSVIEEAKEADVTHRLATAIQGVIDGV